ncbi:MAG: hypothetical protein IJF48_03955 [Clostridia bacterium]|nr:hypothetical protein [Clostridia bacterium]
MSSGGERSDSALPKPRRTAEASPPHELPRMKRDSSTKPRRRAKQIRRPLTVHPCAKRKIGLHLGRAKERGRAREGRKPADDELVVAPLVSFSLCRASAARQPYT